MSSLLGHLLSTQFASALLHLFPLRENYIQVLAYFPFSNSRKNSMGEMDLTFTALICSEPFLIFPTYKI